MVVPSYTPLLFKGSLSEGRSRSWKIPLESDCMRNIRFWIPAIIGALLTPVCLYLIVMSARGSGASGHAGAGMGAMLLFYPVPVFSMMLFAGEPSSDAFLSHIISRLAFAGMVLQFPLYGFIISYANLKRHLWLRLCAGLVWLHIIAIIGGLLAFFIQALL